MTTLFIIIGLIVLSGICKDITKFINMLKWKQIQTRGFINERKNCQNS